MHGTKIKKNTFLSFPKSTVNQTNPPPHRVISQRIVAMLRVFLSFSVSVLSRVTNREPIFMKFGIGALTAVCLLVPFLVRFGQKLCTLREYYYIILCTLREYYYIILCTLREYQRSVYYIVYTAWIPTACLLYFLPRVKRLGHGVDHWPPSSAEVKNEWSYTSTHIPS
jgi:hypothetical protein